MRLANNIRRALTIQCAGRWRANRLEWRIRRGEVRLSDLERLAETAKCSLVFLTSGGRHEADNDLPVAENITNCIMHKGLDKHDFARSLGFRDYKYLRWQIARGKVHASMLIRMAEALKVDVWYMLCDGMEKDPGIDDLVPTQWEQLVELNLMGWLDAKPDDGKDLLIH